MDNVMQGTSFLMEMFNFHSAMVKKNRKQQNILLQYFTWIWFVWKVFKCDDYFLSLSLSLSLPPPPPNILFIQSKVSVFIVVLFIQK